MEPDRVFGLERAITILESIPPLISHLTLFSPIIEDKVWILDLHKNIYSLRACMYSSFLSIFSLSRYFFTISLLHFISINESRGSIFTPSAIVLLVDS